ncbi:heme ABC exporter ATP-binding protein CcmA [Siculibacillus lacustris]|uniref:heme ABC exporter ATP-binding protein CcmA n=1 Tax=Siculibacillus lacustris TaxID=1549641 RepID=UPI001D18DD6C|nr:heme ABC exporter ATP-binding protein CcmA [Siculibacillus lacustris]
MTTAAVERLTGERLTLDRGGRRVLDGLSFTARAGTALIVTGANGSGKSTLLRLVAGLLRPVGGRLALTGGDPELTIGQQCHYFGHQDALKGPLTVAENLAFWRDFGGVPALAVDAALDRVGLGRLAGLPAAYLSAGQRRRLAFARLLVTARPVWLLDEPTAALDAAAEARLTEIVAGHLAAGGVVMAATHLPLALPASENLALAPGNGERAA